MLAIRACPASRLPAMGAGGQRKLEASPTKDDNDDDDTQEDDGDGDAGIAKIAKIFRRKDPSISSFVDDHHLV